MIHGTYVVRLNIKLQTIIPILYNTNLKIVLWVPVAVVYDAGVGRRQVDAQPARLRAQQEHKPKIFLKNNFTKMTCVK